MSSTAITPRTSMSDVDHVNGESCDLWSTPGEDAEEEEDEDEEEKRSSSCSRDAEEKMKMIQTVVRTPVVIHMLAPGMRYGLNSL